MSMLPWLRLHFARISLIVCGSVLQKLQSRSANITPWGFVGNTGEEAFALLDFFLKIFETQRRTETQHLTRAGLKNGLQTFAKPPIHPLFCAISDSGPLSSQSLSVEKAGDCKGFCREQHNEASRSHWPVLNWRLENGCCGKPFYDVLYIRTWYSKFWERATDIDADAQLIQELSLRLSEGCVFSYVGLWFGAMSSYQLYSL